MGLALTNKMVATNVQAEAGKVLVHWACSFAALRTLELPREQDWD